MSYEKPSGCGGDGGGGGGGGPGKGERMRRCEVKGPRMAE